MTLTSNYLYLERNLSQEDINKIYELIELGEERDGIHSVGGSDESTRQIKSNIEIILQDEGSAVLNDIVFGTMDSQNQFIDFTIPTQSGTPILSRMNIGDFYKPHQDNYNNGDYSTTIFLSDPETYEGGELCLWINNEEVKFKPPQGSSVTYKTGTPHRVNPVTKGTRDAAIFWTHSLLKDPLLLEIYHGLNKIRNSCQKEVSDTLNEALSNPRFVADNLMQLILRNSYKHD